MASKRTKAAPAAPAGSTFEDLLKVVATLRDPGGCPWDAEQTHASLRQYLLEETYEAIEAIDNGGPAELAEELGDLLTHIAFHADIARRAGEWDAQDLVGRVIAKLIRRHPHVFGAGPKIGTAQEVAGQWEAIKRTTEGKRRSAADGIPVTLPALAYAAALQKRGAAAGATREGATKSARVADNPEFAPIEGESSKAREQRAGAYLWEIVQLLRDAGVDPETALRATAGRFHAALPRT